MIELEMFIVFYATIFFTLLYVWQKEILFGIITFGGWFALGMMWMLINPMTTGYAVALFFQAIGFLFLLTVIVQYLRQLDVERGYKEEGDEL